jgi:hypothetical protein
VYAQGADGIGGYGLADLVETGPLPSTNDGSRNLDHLALYRPGTSTIWIS